MLKYVWFSRESTISGLLHADDKNLAKRGEDKWVHRHNPSVFFFHVLSAFTFLCFLPMTKTFKREG
jgi:hypothetical protein